MLALVVKKALAVYPGPSSLYRGIDLSRANAADMARMMLLRPKPCQRRIDHHHAGDSAGCVVSQGDLGAEPFRGRLPATADRISARVGSPVFDFNQMETACSDWENGYQEMEHFTNACDIEFLKLNAVRSTSGLWLSMGILSIVVGLAGALLNATGNIAVALCLGVPFVCIGAFCLATGRKEGLTESGQTYAGECLGLKRYMEDFSNFSDRGALRSGDVELVSGVRGRLRHLRQGGTGVRQGVPRGQRSAMA